MCELKIGEGNLRYISTVDVADGSAQSMQIHQMCTALERFLPGQFQLLSFSSRRSAYTYPAKLFSLSVRYSKFIRTVILTVYALMSANAYRFVFTRDLYIAMLLSHFGINVVWECHQKLSSTARFMVRLFGRRKCFRVLAISSSLSKHGGILVSPDRLFVYHDCANFLRCAEEELKCFQTELISKYGEKIACYTGALHKGRDVYSLTPLFSSFPDWSFLIVGGRDKSEVIQYREAVSKFPNVYVIGRVDQDKAKYYQCCANVLLYPLTKTNPLWRWTSPLKLFEYMAAGRPIVASVIGSVSEILDDENAFCFEGEEGIVQAFSNYLSSPAEVVSRKVEKNIESVRIVFNWGARAKYIINNCFA